MTWFGLRSASKIAYGVVSGVSRSRSGPSTACAASNENRPRHWLQTDALFARIILPLALPSIVTGLRIGLALTVIGVIASEMLALLDGIGYLISYNRTMFNTDRVYLGISLAVAFAHAANLRQPPSNAAFRHGGRTDGVWAWVGRALASGRKLQIFPVLRIHPLADELGIGRAAGRSTRTNPTDQCGSLGPRSRGLATASLGFRENRNRCAFQPFLELFGVDRKAGWHALWPIPVSAEPCW